VSGQLLLLLLIVGATGAAPTVEAWLRTSQYIDWQQVAGSASYGADYSIDAGRGGTVLFAIKLGDVTVATITLGPGRFAPLRTGVIAATIEDFNVLQETLAQTRARLALSEPLERAAGAAVTAAPSLAGPLAESPFSGPLGLAVPDAARTAVAPSPGGVPPNLAVGAVTTTPGPAGAPPPPGGAPPASTPAPPPSPAGSGPLSIRPTVGTGPPPEWVDVPTMTLPTRVPSPGPSNQGPALGASGPAAGPTGSVVGQAATPGPTQQGLAGGGGTSGGAGAGAVGAGPGAGPAGPSGPSSPSNPAVAELAPEPNVPVAISPFSTPVVQLQPPLGGPSGGGGGGAFLITSDRTGRPTLPNGVLAPGQAISGTVRLDNPGTVAWIYSLECKGGGGPLWSDATAGLQLEIRRASDNVLLHRGPIAKPTGPLGEVDAGGHVDLDVSVLLPREAPNSFQGQRITVDFVWTAQSTS
jgi:hypothetical protein